MLGLCGSVVNVAAFEQHAPSQVGELDDRSFVCAMRSFSDAEDQQVGLGTSLTALEILSSSRQGRSIGSPSLLGGAGIGEALHPAAGAASLSPGSGEPSGEGGAHFLPDLNEGQHGQQQVPPPPDVIPYEYTEHTPAVEGGGRDVREVDDDDECFDFEL